MSPSEFAQKVVSSYLDNHGIFRNKINAEELIPQNITDLNKAQYIFYVLQLDYAMRSQILYSGALKLHKLHTNFFTPKFITELSYEQLKDYLVKYLHPRYINEAIKRYQTNTEILVKDFNGDPRSIFDSSTNCKELIAKIGKFRGFGPKIGNFFARTMINTFNYIYADLDEMLPPVDVHDVRIAYIMGYIDSDEMTLKNINQVKEIWNKACVEATVSWLLFDKALWLLGSEGKPKTKEDILGLIL